MSSSSDEEAPDFDYLLKMPKGSHFMLKSEQQKFIEDTTSSTSTKFSKYFNVDCEILNLALKSIPFYERQDVTGITWTEDELQAMTEVASQAEERYRDVLEKSLDKPNLAKEVKKLKIQEEPKAAAAETEAPSDKASIQKWLDDILDI